MNYPLISEYVEAIKSAEDNFATLTNLRPILDEDRNPVMTSGNFAVVFKMKDEESGKHYAVKCFLKDQPNRAESYKMIADELEYVSSTFLVQFRYLDKELFVDASNSDEDEFPVLVMDWVEGVTLDKYIRQNIDDQYALQMLAYQFSKLAMWIIPQPFAHGDIKPDNIMVRDDGSLVLIDYDGMYVPAMKGQKARELGSPDFRHPSRTEDDFDEHIDDFSLITILLSLCAIANDSSLLDKYGAADRLLFSEKDYRDISSCKLLKELYPSTDNEINTLISLFIIAIIQSNLSRVSFRLLSINRPEEQEILSTEVTEEDLANAWTDEYGVKYSKDRMRLLKTPRNIKEYTVLQCTLIIADSSFEECEELSSVIIPFSVKAIGKRAFYDCSSLKTILLPNSIQFIGSYAFEWCYSIKSFNIPSSVTKIENNPFVKCRCIIYSQSNNYIVIDNCLYNSTKKELISYIGNKNIYSIPTGVEKIGKSAFSQSSIEHIKIPNTVTIIEESAFSNCNDLQTINIPNSVTKIGNYAFFGCRFYLQSIQLPNSLSVIGDEVFGNCFSLNNIRIPYSTNNIGVNPFVKCECTIQNESPFFEIYEGSLYTVGKKKLISYLGSQNCFELPSSVAEIGSSAFEGNMSLFSLNIPFSVKKIGKWAFNWCECLKTIVIPNSITVLEEGVFCACGIESINIPSSVTVIGRSAFSFCKYFKEINIPNSVTKIEDSAFEECEALESVYIPSSIMHIGKNVFAGCYALKSLYISHETFNRLFGKDYFSDIIKFTD